MPNYKKVSQKQERRVAKEVSGKPTLASGALYFAKSDVRSPELLIECKTTEKSYYPLKVATWLKAEKEALKDSMRVPMMQIDLLNGEVRYAIFRHEDFTDMFPTLASKIGQPLPPIATSNKSVRVETDTLFIDPKIKYPIRLLVFDGLRTLVLISMSDFLYMKKEVFVNE